MPNKNNLNNSINLLIIAIEELNKVKEDRMKSDIKSEVDKEKIFIAPFSPKTLASDPELFKSLLMEHGRVPYQLDNNAVITVCRPLLCFENKTNDFKTTRFLVEQGFWKKKLSDESLGDDWKILSRVVLELF